MGLTKYWRPPSKEEVSWNNILFSFGVLLILSFIMYLLFGLYEESNNLSIFIFGFLWLFSFFWFISSIRSKYLTKKEFKSVFNLKVIFSPVTFVFGSLFGLLGGMFFATIIEVMFEIQDYGLIFYLLWGLGFVLFYSIITIIAGNSR